MISGDAIRLAEKIAIMDLGRAGAAACSQTAVSVFAPELRESLQRIADGLTKAAECNVPCRVHVVNSPVIHAFVLPCGDIFVYGGLLDTLDTRDEIAAVLAHEIAHVKHQDGLEKLRHTFDQQRSATVTAALLGAVAAGAASGALGSVMSQVPMGPPVAEVYGRFAVGPCCDIAGRLAASVPQAMVIHLMRLSIAQYSRERELRADRCSLEYLRKAGYNPEAAVAVMEKLREAHERHRR